MIIYCSAIIINKITLFLYYNQNEYILILIGSIDIFINMLRLTLATESIIFYLKDFY